MAREGDRALMQCTCASCGHEWLVELVYSCGAWSAEPGRDECRECPVGTEVALEPAPGPDPDIAYDERREK